MTVWFQYIVAAIISLIFIYLFLKRIIINIKKWCKNSKNKKELLILIENEGIKEKEFNKKIKDMLKDSSIPDSVKETFNFNFYKVETINQENNENMAWKTFVLIITSVLANNSRGKTGEAIDSIFNIFSEIKTMVKNNKFRSLTSEFLIIFLNNNLRPILNLSRKYFIVNDQGKNELKDKYNEDSFEVKIIWDSIDNLRNKLIKSNDLKILSLLSRSNFSSKDIFKLLNVDYEENKDDILIPNNEETNTINLQS